MNTLNVAIVTIKSNMRNPRAMATMILMPIVLMIILSVAFSGSFKKQSIGLKDVKILYMDENHSKVSSAIKEFITAVTTQKQDITFEKASSNKSALERIENAKYTVYIRGIGNKIEVYKSTNPTNALNASLLETYINSYITRYNIKSEIIKAAPTQVSKIKSNANQEYVKLVSMGQVRQQTSTDYFSVTVLLMIILYSAFSGAIVFMVERTGKTIIRLNCSPIKKYEIFLGKLIGSIFITLFEVIILIIFTKFILGAYWGNHMGMNIIVIISEIVFAISLGIFTGLVFKEEGGVFGFLTLVIPITIFLGGGFVPLDSFSGILLNISSISPMRWTNQALFGMIFRDSFKYVPAALGINFGLSVILIIISTLYSSRKEA